MPQLPLSLNLIKQNLIQSSKRPKRLTISKLNTSQDQKLQNPPTPTFGNKSHRSKINLQKKQSLSTLGSVTEPYPEYFQGKRQEFYQFDFTFNPNTEQTINNNASQIITNHFTSHQKLNTVLFSVLFNHVYLFNQAQKEQLPQFTEIIAQSDNIIQKLIKLIKEIKSLCSQSQKIAFRRFYKFVKHIKEENHKDTTNLAELVKLFDHSFFQLILSEYPRECQQKAMPSSKAGQQDQKIIKVLCEKLGITVRLYKEDTVQVWGQNQSKALFNLGYSVSKQSYFLRQIQYKLIQ